MPQEFKQNATERGTWSQTLEDVEPGHHVITVTDEAGNSDQILLYVTAPMEAVRSEKIELVREPVSTGETEAKHVCRETSELYGMLIVAVAVVATIMSVRQYRTRDKSHGSAFLMIVGVFVSLASVLLWMMFAFVFNETCSLSMEEHTYGIETETGSFSGSLVGARDDVSLAGVSLLSGSQSVTTSDSGIFSFSDFSSGDAISISHPELRESVLLRSGLLSDSYPLLFDVDLYNAFAHVSVQNAFSHIERYDIWNAADGKQYANAYAIVAENGIEYVFVYENRNWKSI